MNQKSLKKLIKKIPPAVIPEVKKLLEKEGLRLSDAQKEILKKADKARALYESEARLPFREQERLSDKRRNFYERMNDRQKKTYERVSGEGC